MRVTRNGITAFAIVSFISFCCFLVLLWGDSDTIMYGVPWHLQGQVLDNASNTLSGVNITISTIKSIGGINSIFGRGPRKESHFQTESDADGRFDLHVKGVDVQMRFEKDGFMPDKRAFWYGGTACDNTNQSLRIVLKAQGN